MSNYIGRVDAETGAYSWFETPTQHSRPRRVRMDPRTASILANIKATKSECSTRNREIYGMGSADRVDRTVLRHLGQEW